MSMKDPAAMLGSSAVPAFLAKLWILVEDPSNADVIAWNRNGQNFCILDEQRFSKEILPKYFKHNNLSSFIRQLNMYGFKKVLNLESGLMKSECATGIEFQHPFFKKGRAEMLDVIKRKISSVKPGDPNLSQEELQKVFYELQELKDAQSDVDTQLDNMRRENEALWKEVSSLRRKHSQQQKLLGKILQFIISLMRRNIVVGSKRKRALKIEASQPPSKYARHVLHLTEDAEKQADLCSQLPGNSADDVLVIHEIKNPGEGTSNPHPPNQDSSQNYGFQLATTINTASHSSPEEMVLNDQPIFNSQMLEESAATFLSSSANEDGVVLDVVQASAAEDPNSVINAIFNENNNVDSTDMFDCEDIQDFMSCIDATLEDLQSMLSKKKLNMEVDFIDELFKPDLLSSDTAVTDNQASLTNALKVNDRPVSQTDHEDLLNKDMQVMQYMGNTLLSNCGSADPTALLTGTEDDLLLGSSEEPRNNCLVEDTGKEADLLIDDFGGSHGQMPIFVLSPVSKLLDEVTETDVV